MHSLCTIAPGAAAAALRTTTVPTRLENGEYRESSTGSKVADKHISDYEEEVLLSTPTDPAVLDLASAKVVDEPGWWTSMRRAWVQAGKEVSIRWAKENEERLALVGEMSVAPWSSDDDGAEKS